MTTEKEPTDKPTDVVLTDKPLTEDDFRVHPTELTPFEGDYMDVTVQVADGLAKYEKAIDAIMNFIIKRTYAGDWVCHSKQSDPIEDRVVNMIGAAAERVARDLGIQETDRTEPEKHWHEKNPGHYYYTCRAKFTFRGRTVEAIGEASTLNPFYSKAYGGKVAPEDIREDYLRREAVRDATKQGIRALFGLRRIPLMKLKELGYDITKVKYVNFKENAKSQSAQNPDATKAPEASEKLTITIGIQTLKARTWNKKDIIDVVAEDGTIYSWWGVSINSPDGKRLQQIAKDDMMASIQYEVKGQYKNIMALIEGVPR